MTKLARACAVAVAVATSLAGGIAAAQIQGGVARKAAPASIALGVPGAKANISQRSSASARSGSSLSFASGQPALRYQAVDLPTAKDPVRREAVKDGAKEANVSARGAAAAGTASTAGAGSATSEFAPAPGVLRANMPPVTFADAERVLKTRVLPVNVNQGVTAVPKTGKTSTLARMKIAGDAAASGPASIAELARALRNHPDLIYQYVRNNVEYYPTFGSQKGALGAVLDNQATAHDQAALMVELLRASGLEANYVRGIAKLSAAQLAEWWGVNTANACGVLSLLGQAQIPVYEINATTAGSCPGTVAALTDVSIEHIWVKTRINGNWYVFDPSYKPHTFKSGIDLASATTTGYDAPTYQSSAQSGATVTADYVQNLNRTNIRNNLNTYATKLASYLRANKPAATLDDVLGGKTIVPFYGALRQTSLPYQNTAWGSEELAELPGYMKPTLRVQYQGIDQTYTSDAIYGRRLTLTYNGANQPILKLDGVAVGSPGTAVKTLSHQYDAAGNRIRTTWPDAFYTTTSYDAANRPSVIQESGTTNLASYAYDDLGRRTTVTLGNGTTIQRNYDNQGALATLKNFLASPSQEVQYTYTRNQLRELKSVAWTNNLYQWSGATPGTKSYTSNGLNQYTAAGGAAHAYDTNGNLTGDGTWSYGYDLDNRLKTASKTGTAASLSYDAEGRLRQTAIGTTTTNLLYDATNLIAEYDAAGTTLQRRYVHGPGTDEPIVWYEGSGTTAKNWFYADHLGSIVATANATGASTGIYSYGPYGEPNTTTGPRFRYTGQQLIGELGLYHYKARFYSPNLGRFLQTDPIGYKDDVNLYAYVGNNPVNRTDPKGLSRKEATELTRTLADSSNENEVWQVAANSGIPTKVGNSTVRIDKPHVPGQQTHAHVEPAKGGPSTAVNQDGSGSHGATPDELKKIPNGVKDYLRGKGFLVTPPIPLLICPLCNSTPSPVDYGAELI